jgi:hypothetical protein
MDVCERFIDIGVEIDLDGIEIVEVYVWVGMAILVNEAAGGQEFPNLNLLYCKYPHRILSQAFPFMGNINIGALNNIVSNVKFITFLANIKTF